MKIIEPHSDTGWITVEIDNCYVEAKVYDTPSIFGIDGGRISKLFIARKDGKAMYNYDRGLDFNEVTHKLLKKVIKELEKLPPLF